MFADVSCLVLNAVTLKRRVVRFIGGGGGAMLQGVPAQRLPALIVLLLLRCCVSVALFERASKRLLHGSSSLVYSRAPLRGRYTYYCNIRTCFTAFDVVLFHCSLAYANASTSTSQHGLRRQLSSDLYVIENHKLATRQAFGKRQRSVQRGASRKLNSSTEHFRSGFHCLRVFVGFRAKSSR